MKMKAEKNSERMINMKWKETKFSKNEKYEMERN